MDYVKNGSVNSKIYWKTIHAKKFDENKKYNIDNNTLRKYFRDLLRGLDYCFLIFIKIYIYLKKKKTKIHIYIYNIVHNFAHVVHRDIKPDNLLISTENELKIADFGVSSIFENENDELLNDKGTKCYLAPEIFNSTKFNGRPADIWAVGVSFFEIIVGSKPF